MSAPSSRGYCVHADHERGVLVVKLMLGQS
jgi:hypothetical protein